MSRSGMPNGGSADRPARHDRWRDFENGVLRLNLVCNGFDAMAETEAPNSAAAASTIDTGQLLGFLTGDLPKLLRQQRTLIRNSLKQSGEAGEGKMSLMLLKEDQDRLLKLADDLAETLTKRQRLKAAEAQGDLPRMVSRFVAALRHYLGNSTKLAKKCML